MGEVVGEAAVLLNRLDEAVGFFAVSLAHGRLLEEEVLSAEY